MLTRYGRTGASSRMRSYQYLPWLESAGIDATVSPLLSDSYVAGLQLGDRNIREVISGYWQRLQTLVNSRSFDLVWIEKEALPWLPASLENVLLPKRIPYVLDYDDAVFHYYDRNHNLFVRHLLRDKHSELIRRAALVVAGNEYIAGFAKNAGAQRVEIVPTVIDLDRYSTPVQKSVPVKSMPPCIGWIGQRSTAPLLMPHKKFFQRLASEGKARFVAIGIDAPALGLQMESIPWTEQTEVDSIMGLDIGIMPLVDEPFERGKCGYKLIQYMACGLPVVASPVGVNRQIVEHGLNGFLAETPEQWEQALMALLSNPGLSKRMGEVGRQKVEQQYSIQVTGPMLAAMIKTAASASGKPSN